MDEVIYKTDLICETNNINQQRDVNTIQTLREIDRNIMSWSDTVHYQDNPIIANHCQGEIITDLQGNNYIDTQMWHSSCNFGYRNMQIENAVRHQLDQLPQVSGDFLHVDKLLLAKEVEEAIFERTGQHGRISFNVGGTLVVEDALKIVRRHTGRRLHGGLSWPLPHRQWSLLQPPLPPALRRVPAKGRAVCLPQSGRLLLRAATGPEPV